MTIDIILITYNQEKFILSALDSIKQQKLPADCEVNVIIADDCSTDTTLELIRSKENEISFHFIYLPYVKNVGISQNYKKAFSYCHGDYIAVLEGDDYWISDQHLIQHIDFLNTHPECSMSMNKLIIQDDETGIMSYSEWPYTQEFHYVDLYNQISYGNQLGNLSACMFRTYLIKQIPSNFYDMSIADWMIGILMAEKGLIAILRQPTSIYRMNSKSQWAALTSKEQTNVLLEDIKLYDKYQNYKYHSMWMYYKKRIISERAITYKDLFPPLLIKFVKSLVPTIIFKLRKYGK